MRISDWSSDVCSSDLTVFQSYALFPHLTVGQNIGFGLEMLGRPREQRAQRVEQMLALVKLAGYANRRPAQLSGGQQQRVALARALARSEEHTSELQSLMRISYAVFCLKKKKNSPQNEKDNDSTIIATPNSISSNQHETNHRPL